VLACDVLLCTACFVWALFGAVRRHYKGTEDVTWEWNWAFALPQHCCAVRHNDMAVDWCRWGKLREWSLVDRVTRSGSKEERTGAFISWNVQVLA